MLISLTKAPGLDLKAGVDTVLCWDLNPWSTEGLRRGACANKWQTYTHGLGSPVQGDISISKSNMAMQKTDAKILIFNESNEHASRRVHHLREHIPPIRHVNCGLLPTSRGSWRTAIEVLDPDCDGWIHVHENFALAEIEQKAEEVRAEMQTLCIECGYPGPEKFRKVSVVDINRLKSYAPGVIHCVVDMLVSARRHVRVDSFPM